MLKNNSSIKEDTIDSILYENKILELVEKQQLKTAFKP